MSTTRSPSRKKKYSRVKAVAARIEQRKALLSAGVTAPDRYLRGEVEYDVGTPEWATK